MSRKRGPSSGGNKDKEDLAKLRAELVRLNQNASMAQQVSQYLRTGTIASSKVSGLSDAELTGMPQSQLISVQQMMAAAEKEIIQATTNKQQVLNSMLPPRKKYFRLSLPSSTLDLASKPSWGQLELLEFSRGFDRSLVGLHKAELPVELAFGDLDRTVIMLAMNHRWQPPNGVEITIINDLKSLGMPGGLDITVQVNQNFRPGMQRNPAEYKTLSTTDAMSVNLLSRSVGIHLTTGEMSCRKCNTYSQPCEHVTSWLNDPSVIEGVELLGGKDRVIAVPVCYGMATLDMGIDIFPRQGDGTRKYYVSIAHEMANGDRVVDLTVTSEFGETMQTAVNAALQVYRDAPLYEHMRSWSRDPILSWCANSSEPGHTTHYMRAAKTHMSGIPEICDASPAEIQEAMILANTITSLGLGVCIACADQFRADRQLNF